MAAIGKSNGNAEMWTILKDYEIPYKFVLTEFFVQIEKYFWEL